MTGWGMPEVVVAMPETSPAVLPTSENDEAQARIMDAKEAGAPQAKNPQEHGWVPKTDYDYSTYMKSTKELAEAEAAAKESAAPGVEVGCWASNAAIYDWDDDYGDVGPRHPELEKQLFGSENHVRMGIKFENLTTLDVHQEGDIRITPIRKFEDAGLHPVMMENVKLAGYNVPTPIQQYCMPAVRVGHDIVACAQTGSGKTAAFLVPIISKLMGKAKKLAAPRPNPATYQEGISARVRAEPLVLIVCPSRELATQIFDEARRFCYRSMLRPCVVYGGGPIAEQIKQLQKGCDILIGTPGRLVDFINRPETLTLKRLKYMVIDEADEMLQSDWEEELNKIMSGGDQEEGNLKYLLFSATFPKAARDLAKQHLAHVHVRIRVGRAGSSHLNIKQDIVYVESSMKRRAVEDLLLSTPPTRTIIFVNSKRSADELDDFLFNKNFPCVSIHSDRTQREREDCIRSFRLGKNPILIATGVSARGLDIHNVMHVINYDLPSAQYGGIEEYTHRIGRTGRIGNMGLATSFYNDRDNDLAENLTKTLLETHQPVPDFLEQYIPEGFTADGSGDINKLKFEADSDYGGEDGAGSAPTGGTTDAWGASPAGADSWGLAPTSAPEAATAQSSSGDALGTVQTPAQTHTTSQIAVSESWGGAVTLPTVPTPVPVQVPPANTRGAVPTSVVASTTTTYSAAPIAPAVLSAQAAPFSQAPSFAPAIPIAQSPVAYAVPVSQAAPEIPVAQQWAPVPAAAATTVPTGVPINTWLSQVVPGPAAAGAVLKVAQAPPTGLSWAPSAAVPVTVQSTVSATPCDWNAHPTAPVVPTAAPAAPAAQSSPWVPSGGWNATGADDW